MAIGRAAYRAVGRYASSAFGALWTSSPQVAPRTRGLAVALEPISASRASTVARPGGAARTSHLTRRAVASRATTYMAHLPCCTHSRLTLRHWRRSLFAHDGCLVAGFVFRQLASPQLAGGGPSGAQSVCTPESCPQAPVGLPVPPKLCAPLELAPCRPLAAGRRLQPCPAQKFQIALPNANR